MSGKFDDTHRKHKYCLACGRELPKHKTSFCNGNCRDEYWKVPHIKICVCCGKEFMGKWSRKLCPECTIKETETKHAGTQAHIIRKTVKPSLMLDDFAEACKSYKARTGKNLKYQDWLRSIEK